MGIAEIIPGVSGGTLAFITGIYQELINSIKSINIESIRVLTKFQFKKFWTNINGSFLLIDNYRSDYTLSIFLKKLLVEYPEKNISISEVLNNNPYRINFEQLQLNSKQVYISEKLRVLALKDESIFESALNDGNNLRLGSSIIFNYLIGN